VILLCKLHIWYIQVIELPSPYGDCEPSENYTQSECLAECEANYVISNCSCKDIYMPGITSKNVSNNINSQWRFYVGARGTGLQILPRPPPQMFRVITVHKLLNTGQLDTVVLLVVASQMMRGQAPQIFFPRTAPVNNQYLALTTRTERVYTINKRSNSVRCNNVRR